MIDAKEQENLIKELCNRRKDELQEMIRQIYSINFSEEETFDYTFIIGAIGKNKLDIALNFYWQLDENKRMIFIELIN